MKIGVFSDIHDNAHNLVLALRDMEARGVERGLFLGDLGSNVIAKVLAGAPFSIRGIFGNNDGDKAAFMTTALAEGSSIAFANNVYDSAEVGGRKIFFSHYPNLAEFMARSGEFDAVFYGHDHDRHEERVGECLLANPGEIAASRTGTATYLIYDTNENAVEFVELEDVVSVRTDIVARYREERGLGTGKR